MNTCGLLQWLWFVLFLGSVSFANAQFTSRIDCLFPAGWDGKETKLIRKSIDQTLQIDTAIIVNRQATFTVTTTDLCSAYIWVEGNADDINFLIDSPKINIAFDPQASLPIVISGSPSSDIWRQQRDLLHQLNEAQEDWQPTFNSQVTSDDSLMSYVQHADSVREAYTNVVANLIENNPSLTSSWYLFATQYASFPYAQAHKLFGQLTTFKNYPSYQKLAADLLAKQPGKMAIDFTLPDLSEKPITLSKLTRKFILIDFSDAHLISCRQRHEKLKKIYKAYQPAGLEILTIYSVYGQQAPKELFQKEKLPWLVTIDDGVSVLTNYHIERTPDNVLLNEHKKVIAHDLSPDELATTLSELVKK
ncbi:MULTISPECIES: TlpA disulfide reductase family protein [unclassified Spirosoma]|uniref:TlpA disulfide reductase family protein n=1 Tax=unclassified Spirosoma TaxID=2621999 RepID=UPI000959E066|nr:MULTISPECIES: TlpA disulfide reductase family protein [unclassified Spirosoma]MBN8821711.1 AhpC/TSA family protein [Spirosoma sp.]OJW80793.1 MAG: hypothetical protein BGO59_35635 [Spirosoma sp. 48-14]